jgi:cell division protein FtsL
MKLYSSYTTKSIFRNWRANFLKLKNAMGDIKDFVESDKILRMKRKNEKNKPLSSKDIFGFFLGTILTFLPLFATVYIKSQIISQGYKIAKIVKEVEELQDKRDFLAAKLNSLENPKNFFKIAQKMGYELPSIDKITFITKNNIGR